MKSVLFSVALVCALGTVFIGCSLEVDGDYNYDDAPFVYLRGDLIEKCYSPAELEDEFEFDMDRNDDCTPEHPLEIVVYLNQDWFVTSDFEGIAFDGTIDLTIYMRGNMIDGGVWKDDSFIYLNGEGSSLYVDGGDTHKPHNIRVGGGGVSIYYNYGAYDIPNYQGTHPSDAPATITYYGGTICNMKSNCDGSFLYINEDDVYVTFTNVNFVACCADGEGGLVYAANYDYVWVWFEHCIIDYCGTYRYGSDDGGVVYWNADDSGRLTFKDCKISNCFSGDEGSAIYMNNGELVLDDVAIIENWSNRDTYEGNIIAPRDPNGEHSAVMIDDASIIMRNRVFIFDNLTNHLNPYNPNDNGKIANLAIWSISSNADVDIDGLAAGSCIGVQNRDSDFNPDDYGAQKQYLRVDINHRTEHWGKSFTLDVENTHAPANSFPGGFDKPSLSEVDNALWIAVGIVSLIALLATLFLMAKTKSS